MANPYQPSSWNLTTSAPTLPASINPLASPTGRGPSYGQPQTQEQNPVKSIVDTMMDRIYGQQSNQFDQHGRRRPSLYQSQTGTWHTRIDARSVPSPANSTPFSEPKTPGLDSWHALNQGPARTSRGDGIDSWSAKAQRPNSIQREINNPPQSIIPAMASAGVPIPASVDKGVSSPINSHFSRRRFATR